MNEELRQEAEERLKHMDQSTGHLEKEEIHSLFHELKVHQIELEIQNEELRNTQEVLEKTKEKYIRLYNNAPVGYLTVNSAAIILQSNRTFTAMIGKKDASVQGKSLAEFIHPEDRKLFFGRFRAFLNDPVGKDIEVRLFQSGSDPLPVRLTGSLGDGTDLLIIVSDIRDQKASEKRITNLLEEKELLLREVHHRIKNNMNTISSLLMLQSYSVPDKAAAEALKEAQERVRTMMILYEDLYRDADFNTLEVKPYLTNLMRNMEESYGDQPGVSLNGSFGDIVMNDKDALALGIIMNELVANAYKYAFRNRSNGRIDVTLDQRNDGDVFFSVRDNGAGIPETQEAAEGDSGGGFGLTLVENLTAQLGGELSVRKINPGTEFSILIPQRD